MRKWLTGFIALAALAAAAGIVVALGGAGPVASQRKPDRLMLLYVGAEDCAPCRIWQRDAAVSFQASKEFTQLVYREVKSPTLLDVLKDEYWPPDLRAFRAQIGPAAGVPLWLVIADGAIVGRGFGPSQWQRVVLPQIKSLVR
jgi:hypothetical protein